MVYIEISSIYQIHYQNFSSGSREVSSRNAGEIPSSSQSRTTRTKAEQGAVRRVTQEGRAVRRRDEARRETLAKRSSTISSVSFWIRCSRLYLIFSGRLKSGEPMFLMGTPELHPANWQYNLILLHSDTFLQENFGTPFRLTQLIFPVNFGHHWLLLNLFSTTSWPAHIENQYLFQIIFQRTVT